MELKLEYRSGIRDQYADILTAPALAPLNRERLGIMVARIERRRARARHRQRIEFLDPDSLIPRTNVKVADARAGNFDAREIPTDLDLQWVQGTGPAPRPRAPRTVGLRSVAYALLSGADGWMFDGEDALGRHDVAR